MRLFLIASFAILVSHHSNGQGGFLVEVGGVRKIDTKFKVDSITKIIEENPTQYQNYYTRAGLLYQAGRASEALNDITLFLSNKSGDYQGHLLLGKIHVIRINPIKAIEEFDRAIKINTKNPAAYIEKAAVLCSRSDLENALSFINSSLKLFPKEKELNFYRGYVFLKYRQFKKSISDLQLFIDSATEKDSLKLAIAYHHAADANLSIKNYEEALALVNISIKTVSDFQPAFGLRGEIKYKWKDIDGALADLIQMEKNGFESSRYWRVLGAIYEEKSNFNMACAYFTKYCKFVRDDDPERRTCVKILKLNCK